LEYQKVVFLTIDILLEIKNKEDQVKIEEDTKDFEDKDEDKQK